MTDKPGEGFVTIHPKLNGSFFLSNGKAFIKDFKDELIVEIINAAFNSAVSQRDERIRELMSECEMWAGKLKEEEEAHRKSLDKIKAVRVRGLVKALEFYMDSKNLSKLLKNPSTGSTGCRYCIGDRGITAFKALEDFKNGR